MLQNRRKKSTSVEHLHDFLVQIAFKHLENGTPNNKNHTEGRFCLNLDKSFQLLLIILLPSMRVMKLIQLVAQTRAKKKNIAPRRSKLALRTLKTIVVGTAILAPQTMMGLSPTLLIPIITNLFRA